MPNKIYLSIAAVAFSLSAFTADAGTIELDQSVLTPVLYSTDANDNFYWGQSFSVGKTGLLSGISGLIAKTSTADKDLLLTLMSLDPSTGLITNVFGTVSKGVGDLSTSWCSGEISSGCLTLIDVSALDIQVKLSDKLAFIYYSDLSSNVDLNNDGFVDDDAKRIVWLAGDMVYEGGGPLAVNLSGPIGDGFIGQTWVDRTTPGQYDLIFQTYVTSQVPLPGTLGLLGIGLAGLGFVRRKANA